MADDQKKTRRRYDPYYQDELDVLEAVVKLEEKHGKKFLSDEQREKLLKAREYLKSIGKENDLKVGGQKLSDDNPVKAAKIFMYAMKRAVVTILLDIYKYCTRDEWENKDPQAKNLVLKMFFYLIYGIKEEEFLSELNNAII